MQLSRVDLPQPDGPSSTMNSPSLDVEIEVLQDRDGPKLSDRSLTETLVVHCAHPFTAPAAMPRTNSLPEMK